MRVGGKGRSEMQVHDKRDVLDVKNATVANSRFDDVNLTSAHVEDKGVGKTAHLVTTSVRCV